MTRKEQIKAILDDTLKVVVEEADINGKHCIGRKIILGKSEASEKIASLPLDVPGDDEMKTGCSQEMPVRVAWVLYGCAPKS